MTCENAFRYKVCYCNVDDFLNSAYHIMSHLAMKCKNAVGWQWLFPKSTENLGEFLSAGLGGKLIVASNASVYTNAKKQVFPRYRWHRWSGGAGHNRLVQVRLQRSGWHLCFPD